MVEDFDSKAAAAPSSVHAQCTAADAWAKRALPGALQLMCGHEVRDAHTVGPVGLAAGLAQTPILAMGS